MKKELCQQCKTWAALAHSTLCAECTAQPQWELRTVDWYWDCGFPGCGKQGLAPQTVAMLWDGKKWVRHQCISHDRNDPKVETQKEVHARTTGVSGSAI
jgi:hypothetical protein